MKILKKLFLTLIFVFTVVCVTSCVTVEPSVKYRVTFETNGGSTIKAVEVEAGQKLVLPANPTKEGYNFIGWYTDKALTDTSAWADKVIDKDVTLYAKWEQIIVGPIEEVVPVSASLPIAYINYLNNKKEKENKRTEFYDLTQSYYVGCDNAWSCLPSVTFIKVNKLTGAATPTTVASWTFTINVYILHAEGYVLLEAENNYVESIDETLCKVDFSKEACGQKFKIEVITTGLEDDPDEVVTFEVEVADGYNVYNAKELAYIDNRREDVKNDKEDAIAWKAFKDAQGLDKTYKPSALFLHDNINITVEDLPSLYFYQANELSPSDSDYSRAVGSMKDYRNLYMRILGENETFTITGNYYTLSIETLPVVAREDGQITAEGEVISHTALFRFEGNENGQAVINNSNFIGNAPRVEDKIKAGGVIFNKVEGPKFEAYNNISSCFFIAYMPNYTFAEFVVDHCKAYDSFNCFLYNWGSDKVYLKNSEMIGAGGPIIIQDHVSPNAADGGRIGKVEITNCNLQSYVAGTEGWFTVVKASSIVPQIKQMNALFTPFGRSFVTANADASATYLNFICINKSGSAATITNEKIKGSVKIDDYKFDFGESHPYINAMLNTPALASAPIFETNAGGYGFTNGAGMFNETNTQIVDPNNNIYKGDKLVLYYSGMMLVFEYGQAGQTINH